MASLGEGSVYLATPEPLHRSLNQQRRRGILLSKNGRDEKPVVIKAPADGEEIIYWETPTPFAFAWEKDSLPELEGYFYRLEIARDPAFKTGLFSLRRKRPASKARAWRCFRPIITGGSM